MKRTAKMSMRAAVPRPMWVTLVYLLLLPISMAVSAGIVTLILNLGLVSYAMKVSRLERAGVGSIFDGFDVFFRALWMNICRGFMVFVWSLPVVLVSALVVFLAYTESEEFIYALYLLSPLLCVVTTIVGLKYSMTPYLLFDHPEWSAIRCMRESNSLMKGHKWSLFVLRLSFIGWVFLSAIPFVSLYTIPFMGITEAVFYAQLTSPETEDEDKKLTQETVGVSQQMIVLCEKGTLAGQHRITSGRICIGRDTTCEFSFPQGTSGISRRHCELQLTVGGIVITDLGSSYGTFLENGTKLQPNVPVNLGREGRFCLASPNVSFAAQILS